MEYRLMFLLLTLSAGWAYSQVTDDTQPVVSVNQIIIFNETGNDQEIRIGENSSHLSILTIRKNEKWKSPGFEHRPYIRIYTEDKFQEYLLQPGELYRLYWDERKKCVDIKIIRRKKTADRR